MGTRKLRVIKLLIIIFTLILSGCATTAYAGRYSGVAEALNIISNNLKANNNVNGNDSCNHQSTQTIESGYIDLTPNDGFMDAGSYTNPYVIKNQSGETIAKIKPKYIDLEPNDGFMDAGTPLNPYVIEKE